MTMEGFRFRYINAQCYEFVLPNGKHILIDPYISDKVLTGFREFKLDEIEWCDYVLLTHTHWDHTSDLGTICNKFDSKLFCGAPVAAEISKYFKIKPGRIYPFENMDTYETEDFILKAVRGRHFPLLKLGKYGGQPEDYPEDFGGAGYRHLNFQGTLFSYDFCITLANNMRIMFVSGVDEFNNIYRVADEFRPNILFRHTAGSQPGAAWAKAIARFNAQLALPNHQDNLYSGKWGKTMEDLTGEIQEELKRLGSSTVFVNPEPYRWYEAALSLNVI